MKEAKKSERKKFTSSKMPKKKVKIRNKHTIATVRTICEGKTYRVKGFERNKMFMCFHVCD